MEEEKLVNGGIHVRLGNGVLWCSADLHQASNNEPPHLPIRVPLQVLFRSELESAIQGYSSTEVGKKATWIEIGTENSAPKNVAVNPGNNQMPNAYQNN